MDDFIFAQCLLDLVMFHQNLKTQSSGKTTEIFLVMYARLLQSCQQLKPAAFLKSIACLHMDLPPSTICFIFDSQFYSDVCNKMEEIICRYINFIAILVKNTSRKT